MQFNHNILFSFLSLFIYAPHNVPEWDLNPVLLDWGSAPYPLNHTPHRIPHLYFLPSFTTDPTTHLSANHITPCLPPSTNNPHSDWTHTDLTTHLSTNHITPFFFPPFTSNPHLWLDTHRPNHTSFNQSHYTTFSLHLPATHISDWTHTLPSLPPLREGFPISLYSMVTVPIRPLKKQYLLRNVRAPFWIFPLHQASKVQSFIWLIYFNGIFAPPPFF